MTSPVDHGVDFPTQADEALETLLQVTDVRMENSLRGALKLREGLAAIVDAGQKPASPDARGPGGATRAIADGCPNHSPVDGAGARGALAVLPVLSRHVVDEPVLSDDECRLLREIATGVTADVAARHLELSARTLRRRLRAICDRLGVNTPIEAVVWAARRQLI